MKLRWIAAPFVGIAAVGGLIGGSLVIVCVLGHIMAWVFPSLITVCPPCPPLSWFSPDYMAVGGLGLAGILALTLPVGMWILEGDVSR